jgi:hypothetical protein
VKRLDATNIRVLDNRGAKSVDEFWSLGGFFGAKISHMAAINRRRERGEKIFYITSITFYYCLKIQILQYLSNTPNE